MYDTTAELRRDSRSDICTPPVGEGGGPPVELDDTPQTQCHYFFCCLIFFNVNLRFPHGSTPQTFV